MTAKSLLQYGTLISLLLIPAALMGCGGAVAGVEALDGLNRDALANTSDARQGAIDGTKADEAPSVPDRGTCDATPMPLP